MTQRDDAVAAMCAAAMQQVSYVEGKAAGNAAIIELAGMGVRNPKAPIGALPQVLDLAGVKPYYQDKAFVNAALREKDRQARREFATPIAASNGTPPTPGADVSKVVPMPTSATPSTTKPLTRWPMR